MPPRVRALPSTTNQVTVFRFEPFARRYMSMSEQLRKQRNEAKLAAAKMKGMKEASYHMISVSNIRCV